MLQRHCTHPEKSNEVIAESNMKSVEGLALDWISNNLYFSDRERSVVEMLKVDSMVGQLRRTVLNSTFIDKPRGIAVHPLKGYLSNSIFNIFISIFLSVSAGVIVLTLLVL